jgi:uncharacterized protein YfeS
MRSNNTVSSGVTWPNQVTKNEIKDKLRGLSLNALTRLDNDNDKILKLLDRKTDEPDYRILSKYDKARKEFSKEPEFGVPSSGFGGANEPNPLFGWRSFF